MQQVLVDVCRNNRLGLHVDKVLAAVRLELDCEEVVHAHVPQGLAKDGGASIKCPPSGIARSLDVWLVVWQLCGYGAMEADVGGFRLGDRMVVEVDGGEAADVFVAHALASFQILSVVEVHKRKGLGRGAQALELECCACQWRRMHTCSCRAHRSWRGA